jgi:hypothetical protein
VFTNLPVHISKFGLQYTYPRAKNPARELPDNADRVFDLFESLFEPYYFSDSPESVVQRKRDFNKVLEAAIQHGMKVIGLSHSMIEYRWEVRSDKGIMLAPALHAKSTERHCPNFEVRESTSNWAGGI